MSSPFSFTTQKNPFVLSKTQCTLLSHATLSSSAATEHDIATAPVITSDALRQVSPEVMPSLGLFASVVSQHADHLPPTAFERALWLNMNSPFSALLCGVQGAGKSHSTAVMLEAALMPNKDIGTLPEPLSAIVFHFDSAIGAGCARPCEAAYISKIANSSESSGIPTTILVSPNCVKTMTEVYKNLPVKIRPFQIRTTDLTANRLLSLMQLDEGGKMPLYMSSVLAILRRMGSDGFSYPAFRREVDQLKLLDQQREMLNLRLELLDSFVKDSSTARSIKDYTGKGRLLIVDLSDPFLDAATACSLFRIGLGLFMETGKTEKVGKMVVFDEAHKYLTTEASASELTSDLLSMIRQQRHLGARFVISTQEPTVVPSSILDLCSIILAYRFSSPVWAAHLSKHVSTGKLDSEWFDQVVSLRTGQAILFAPSGFSRKSDNTTARIGRGYLVVQMRQRLTNDGGKSIMACASPAKVGQLATPAKVAAQEVNESAIKFGGMTLESSRPNTPTRLRSAKLPSSKSKSDFNPVFFPTLSPSRT